VTVQLTGVRAQLAAEPEFGQLAIDPPPAAYAPRLVLAGDLLPVATEPSGDLSAEVSTAIAELRSQIRAAVNVVLPGITVADDPALADGVAQLEFDGVQVDEIMSPVHRRFLAGTAEQLDQAGLGPDVRDPDQLADGRQGWWIAEEAWPGAEAAGLPLCSRLVPVLAALAVVAAGNVYHMISIDGVASMLGEARVAEAPADLAGFTQALRLHLAGGLSIDDAGTLCSTYRAERAAGANLTTAAEALRRLPGSRERIGAWCRQRPTAWAGEELEAWFTGRVVTLDSGCVLAFSASDMTQFPPSTAQLTQAAAWGCVLVTRDASLRPLLAWLLRENQIVTPVIIEGELPDGVIPASLDTLIPQAAAAAEPTGGANA
jgi:hypothetical protein